MRRNLSPVKSQTTHIYSHYVPKIPAGLNVSKIPAGLKKTYYAMKSVLNYISAVLTTKLLHQS